ncbi:hypothetical protein BGX30_003794 [Mortierella sp. GBA39]|nr:hypothetical protein BGX30_003794 [Mortierella sp. GBA39]
MGFRQVQQAADTRTEIRRSFQLEAAELGNHPVARIGMLRRFAQRRADVAGDDRTHTGRFQHVAHPRRGGRFAVGAGDPDNRRLADVIGDFHLGHHFDPELQRLLHRRSCVRNSRIFDEQRNTGMNQPLGMTTANDGDSQGLQFPGFGTLILFLSIIHSNNRSGLVQHFGDLHAASGKPEHYDLFTPVRIWMLHLLQPLVQVKSKSREHDAYRPEGHDDPPFGPSGQLEVMRARIPHEYFGRVGVKYKKPEHRPDHGSGTNSGRQRGRLHGDDGECGKSDGAHSGQQSVDPVREIDRVGHSHHHNDDEWIIEPSAPVKRPRRSRYADRRAVAVLDEQVTHDRGEEQLQDKLLLRRQSERTLEHDFNIIIKKSDQAEAKRGYEQYVKIRINDGKFQKSKRKSQNNDDSAHCRRSRLLQMGLRPVVADLLAELHTPKQRNKQRSGNHRENKRYTDR